MAEQKPSTPEIHEDANVEVLDQKKKRRSKGDQSERNFVCQICQKTYLSYPALYTHTKSKHQKTPGKMKQPNEIKKSKPIDTSVFIKELAKILKGQSTAITQQQYTLQQVLEPFKQKQQLKQAIIFSTNSNEQKDEDSSDCIKISIDQVIIRFLNSLLKKIQLSHLQQLCIVLFIWRDTMNKQWRNYEITGEYEVFSQEADTQYVLRAVNDLVLTFFPSQCQSYFEKISKVRILKGDVKDVNLCQILMTISKWLYCQKYTKEKLKYNEHQ